MIKAYTNGDILTMDRKYSRPNVVITEDCVITAVGDKSLINEFKPDEIIDLNGHTLLPGFIVACDECEEKLMSYGITSVITKDITRRLNRLRSYVYLKDTVNVERINNNSIICGKYIVLDGNLWEKKAYLSSPYCVVPDGELLSYSGIGNFKYSDLKRIINECAKINLPLKVYVNGTAAIEQFLTAYERLYANGKLKNFRCVVSGCETVAEKQLARMRMLKIIIEFPIWTLYQFGDFYRSSVIGESGYVGISPLNSCYKTGIPFALEIGSYSVLEAIGFSTVRRTSENFLFDKSQRITPLRAIKSVTVNGAFSIGQSTKIGSITPNKKADFVILSQNPCKVPKSETNKIKVVATIKNGETIYKN